MINPTDILNAKILIVDDLESEVLMLQKMLAAAGYTAITATTDPHEVCALHHRNQYDLILLDLLMPGMDGFQVLENLKAVETKGYVPVLVLTAEPSHKLRALQAGAKDFISKPLDLVETRTRIHNMLEVRLCHRQLADHNQRLEQTVLERTAQLRQSEERFRRLTELSSDWYWEQDADGQFTTVSGPALEMLGLRSRDAQEATGDDPAGPRWNEIERAELEANIAARRPFLDFVYSRTNADGSQQYFQVSGEPMLGLHGRYIGYRGIGMEVTARMRRQ